MADILIIDDEKAIRKTLSEILSFEGYRIDEASDGEEGLKKFRERNYDVVLCDIKMPKIDGIEFLQRAGESNPDIPVIMLSSQDKIDVAINCMHHRAFDYVVKSETAFMRLQKIITTIFQYQKMEKELNWYMERM